MLIYGHVLYSFRRRVYKTWSVATLIPPEHVSSRFSGDNNVWTMLTLNTAVLYPVHHFYTCRPTNSRRTTFQDRAVYLCQKRFIIQHPHAVNYVPLLCFPQIPGMHGSFVCVVIFSKICSKIYPVAGYEFPW